MSNDNINTNLPTEQQVLEWMRVRSRTYDWDALIFYDRFKTNRILLKEYIDRYSREESFFDPVEGRMEIIEGRHWEYLYNTLLDAPRLSFEKSTIASSRATLTLQVLGGTHLTVEQPANQAKIVTRIESYDPLQAPKVTAGLLLNDSDGHVGAGDVVKIDLSKGVDIKLTFGSTPIVQEDGGRFFQSIFNGWDPEKKIFVLNKLQRISDADFMQPDRFRFRVMPAPGADNRNSASFGDGAVMVMVAAVGSEVGSQPDPDADWVYPIPQDRSLTMLLGNAFMMRQLFAKGIRKVANGFGSEFNFDEIGGNGVISGISIKAGNARMYRQIDHPTLGVLELDIWLILSFFDDITFDVKKVGELFILSWKGYDSGIVGPVKLRIDGGYGEYRVLGADATWSAERSYRIHLDDAGSVRMVPVDADITVDLVAEYMSDEWRPYADSILAAARPAVIERFQDFFDRIIDCVGEIDLLRLHGLLFRSLDVASIKSGYAPVDVALFGDLALEAGRFVVDPMEVIVPAGGSLQCRTDPPASSVTWNLERVPGFYGDIGTLSPTGLYTAPPVSSFPSNVAYTTVRVVASGSNGESSGLIRVVTRSVMINPLVTAVTPAGGKVRMMGGALGGARLSWDLVSMTGASLTDIPPDNGAEFDADDMFYVPGEQPSGDAFSIDEVKVTDSNGNTATSYILVVENVLGGKISIAEDSGLPENKLKLEFDPGKGPVDGVVWKVVAGAGEIDADGIYTMNSSSPHRFAVITAFFESVVADFHNYLILPVPLLDLEDFSRAVS
ncbi:hypothetical protein [Stenotrophomonas sp. 278]|uniref:hypothetical protein n=1 Tax=Stenotrophomonas sp. 278 TaxID=2479851 RepID=UPI000F67DB55|nr:hypothetical protein [Stenotrophomonas sp. 278]RRU23518.1 hypothetical protein EGJ34_03060 [Stenotrophomonas sp. 278]